MLVVCVPEVRFSGFVHYLGKVVGWQLGKWDLGGNIFFVNASTVLTRGWGGGFFWKNWQRDNFVAPGSCGFCFEQKEAKKTEGNEGGILKGEGGELVASGWSRCIGISPMAQ